jgi:hypothetical protein
MDDASKGNELKRCACDKGSWSAAMNTDSFSACFRLPIAIEHIPPGRQAIATHRATIWQPAPAISFPSTLRIKPVNRSARAARSLADRTEYFSGLLGRELDGESGIAQANQRAIDRL